MSPQINLTYGENLTPFGVGAQVTDRCVQITPVTEDGPSQNDLMGLQKLRSTRYENKLRSFQLKILESIFEQTLAVF